MKRVAIFTVLTVMFLVGSAAEPARSSREQAIILAYEEMPQDQRIRQYSFESVGLNNVLGCSSGYILEARVVGDLILRWYFDDNGRQLADSWGSPYCGEDVVLAGGVVACNCCGSDGAMRTYVFRGAEDGSIEWGSFDLDPLIHDDTVEFRSIAEEYDPIQHVYRVTYFRHEVPVKHPDPPMESFTIELDELSELQYAAYRPSPEDTLEFIEIVYEWMEEDANA